MDIILFWKARPAFRQTAPVVLNAGPNPIRFRALFSQYLLSSSDLSTNRFRWISSPFTPVSARIRPRLSPNPSILLLTPPISPGYRSIYLSVLIVYQQLPTQFTHFQTKHSHKDTQVRNEWLCLVLWFDSATLATIDYSTIMRCVVNDCRPLFCSSFAPPFSIWTDLSR